MEIAALLCLQQQKGVGPIQARKILAACGNMPDKLAHLGSGLAMDGVPANIFKNWDWSTHYKWAVEQLALCEKYQTRVVSILEDHYPQRLKFIPDAPLVLFYRGDISVANAPRTIAVVGTRNVTDYGKICTQSFCEAMVKANVTVISGLAYGVDTIAHKTSIANGGYTGAVLGHGLQTLYPSGNKGLASKMINNKGFVCSEYPFGIKPDRQNFPTRNRLVVGLSDAVLVVETAIKGGSMVTASFGQQYNKDVFVVPGRINDPYSAGGLALVKHHLAAVCTAPEDILKEMSWLDGGKRPSQQKQILVDARFETIWQHLAVPKTIDELCLLTGKKQSEINGMITEMELEGWVALLPGKRVCKS